MVAERTQWELLANTLKEAVFYYNHAPTISLRQCLKNQTATDLQVNLYCEVATIERAMQRAINRPAATATAVGTV